MIENSNKLGDLLDAFVKSNKALVEAIRSRMKQGVPDAQAPRQHLTEDTGEVRRQGESSKESLTGSDSDQ